MKLVNNLWMLLVLLFIVTPLSYYRVETKPELIRRVDPVYPYNLKVNDGFVIFKVLVDTLGNPKDAVPLIFSDSVFIYYAKEALKYCKFKPGEIDGKKVEAYIEVPFRFKKIRREYPRGIPNLDKNCRGKYLLHVSKTGNVIETKKVEGNCDYGGETFKKFKFGSSMKDYWLLLILGEVRDGHFKKSSQKER